MTAREHLCIRLLAVCLVVVAAVWPRSRVSASGNERAHVEGATTGVASHDSASVSIEAPDEVATVLASPH